MWWENRGSRSARSLGICWRGRVYTGRVRGSGAGHRRWQSLGQRCRRRRTAGRCVWRGVGGRRAGREGLTANSCSREQRAAPGTLDRDGRADQRTSQAGSGTPASRPKAKAVRASAECLMIGATRLPLQGAGGHLAGGREQPTSSGAGREAGAGRLSVCQLSQRRADGHMMAMHVGHSGHVCRHERAAS